MNTQRSYSLPLRCASRKRCNGICILLHRFVCKQFYSSADRLLSRLHGSGKSPPLLFTPFSLPLLLSPSPVPRLIVSPVVWESRGIETTLCSTIGHTRLLALLTNTPGRLSCLQTRLRTQLKRNKRKTTNCVYNNWSCTQTAFTIAQVARIFG